jgi:two-component system, chemotaxis family, protein-glutamate methylesterase/glutaminase
VAMRTVIVIGASAGGIPALTELLHELPGDLPAAVFIVVHISPHAVSRLPAILSRAGPLPAMHPKDADPIVASTIYVAPPDRHLLVRPGLVEISRGPRENRFRPAIDPLFRSAARAYGRNAIGVILSGALFDGVAGLMAIESRGGTTIVQDPDDARIDGMPLSALRMVDADHVLPATEIPGVLTRLVCAGMQSDQVETIVADEQRIEQAIIGDFVDQASDGRDGETTIYSCPDCGGVLWQDGGGDRLRFRCHVGHAYAPEVLLGQKSEELEAALWSSIRLLRERGTLARQVAVSRGRAVTALDGQLGDDDQKPVEERYAELIRELIESLPGPTNTES